ncbi:MAG: hypothetical protein K2Y05_04325 [Hyphomicrobiaceae bacterium]|nr:hypothetical protein [Hyphomicrobiaceae bacterium]
MGSSFSVLRFAVDATVGAAVFVGLTVALLGPSAAAQLVTVGTVPAAGPFSALSADPQALMMVLAVVFSALFALNLAFMRHIRNATVQVRGRRVPGERAD